MPSKRDERYANIVVFNHLALVVNIIFPELQESSTTDTRRIQINKQLVLTQ